ncbi:conserved hypothetical protein [Teredinibacter turnerae T7901]|uniref:Beta-ketoacyl synthase N-terminal domain-containing protein n=2 Tax=Teredinibacter turnerae TaxID=2426 RepID=C5BJW4_TERTT|nr:conserved hypothetical protein [Teredinibacter turnerae T7901]
MRTTMTIVKSLYLDNIRLLCPLGDSAATTYSAVRASISGFADDLFLVPGYERIKAARIPEAALPPLSDALLLEGLTSRQRRILRLSTPSVQALAVDSGALDAPLIWVVAPEAAQTRNNFAQQAPRYLAEQAGVSLHPTQNKILPYGRAGVFQALAEADQMLKQGQYNHVYIGASDTFFDNRSLAVLAADNRVASRSATNAFIPGEAAVFFRVSRQPLSKSAIALGAPGRALEQAHINSDQPCLGAGLDQAWKQALDCLNGSQVSTLISSLNGELYWARELGVAAMRNSAQFSEGYAHLHPADCYGDCGAATGALGIAMACQGLLENQIQGAVLIYSSSDHTPRGAVLAAR